MKTNDAGFEVLFYSNPNPMWIFDVYTLLILEVNEAAIQWYGYSKSEFLTKTILDLRPEKDRQILEVTLKQIRGHQTNHREFTHVTKSGEWLTVTIISYNIVFKGAQARLVHAQNIDEQKAIANHLEVTQSKLEHILENTAIGFCQVDKNWNIVYWNKAAEQIIGYKREHVTSKNIWLVLPELTQTEFYTNCVEVKTNQTSIEFLEYYWPIQKWFSVAAYATEDGLTIHFRDITNRKLFEEALVKRIEHLKQISFFNSHYIRKPVASLIGLTQLVKDELVQEKEFKELAGQIYNCSIELDDVIKKMNEIVNDDKLNYLSRELSEFYISQLLNTIAKRFSCKYRTHQLVIQSYNDVYYYGNKNALQIAIDCLLDNAVKYSPLGSEIHIHTEVVNQHLILSVQDFGVGMSEAKLAELFEYFTSQKQMTIVSGGLKQVIDIVRKHNGYVWAESKLNERAEFSISLPLSNMVDYKMNGNTDFSIYEKPEVKIKHHKHSGCLYVNWIGFHNADSVRLQCLNIIKHIRSTNVTSLFIDNTHLRGIWEDAVEWIVNEWFPQIYNAGIICVASVYSTNTFSKMSVDHVKSMHRTKLVFQTFHSRRDAVKWLKMQHSQQSQPK